VTNAKLAVSMAWNLPLEPVVVAVGNSAWSPPAWLRSAGS